MTNVIVTSGGLSEPIDSVRAITNYSTGTLGALIAGELLDSGASVTYICSNTAKLPAQPDNPNLKIINVNTARELKDQVVKLLENEKYDGFIHSMAVSDYEVDYIDPPLDGAKMSSEVEHPVLHLKQTPKVINLIKQLQPSIKLVGFKLLSNVEVPELIQVAQNLCTRANCDYVIANRKEDITPTKHIAHFINADGEFAIEETKAAIAGRIKSVLSKAEQYTRNNSSR